MSLLSDAIRSGQAALAAQPKPGMSSENGWSTTRIRNGDGSLSNPRFAASGGSANIRDTTGSNSTGQVAFTGDAAFQAQQDALQKAAADYAAQVNAQRQQATQQYDWNREDLNRQSGVDQYNMVNDFAGRGVLNSGLYAKSEDDRSAGIVRQQQQMALGLQNQLNGYNNDLSNFNSENAIALNRAKQDAIARQAAKVSVA